MRTKRVILALLVANAAAIPTASSSVCPPPHFDSVKNFDMSMYLGQWYAQAQAPSLNHAPVGENYCVAKQFTRQQNGSGFDVFNQDRKNSVDGPVIVVKENGSIPNKNEPSKLKVLPKVTNT